MKITFVIGTRPELIKLAPVIQIFIKEGVEVDILNTAQHKDLLDPYWQTFGLKPNFVLDVMTPGQSLVELTTKVMTGVQYYIDSTMTRPDFVMGQGDTTTVMATSLVCFLSKIKFLHLEAGLRSNDLFNPYPEEFNRKIAMVAAYHHFTPTGNARLNLLKEAVMENAISVVGNTVVDTLLKIKDSLFFANWVWRNDQLNIVENFEKVVLVTCHRRENQGENLLNIIGAINILIDKYPDILFVWSLHPNPNVKDFVDNNLSNRDNTLKLEPLDYIDLLKFLSIAFCVITDSGGLQEEAPSFNVPVLILRETTERPEAVDLGSAFIVGTDTANIVNSFNDLFGRDNLHIINPYGDGHASERILEIVLSMQR